jgi:acyl-CoA synthetase (AMP-forming)/AMP-acid ligase II
MKSKSNNNLRELLENRAAKHSDKTFLSSEADGRSWTYLEFNQAVNRAANLLLDNKIKKGDVVSLLLQYFSSTTFPEPQMKN